MEARPADPHIDNVADDYTAVSPTEHAKMQKTFWKVEWLSAGVAVVVALTASISGYAVVRYKTDENAVNIATMKGESYSLSTRLTSVEQHVNDMATQLNRIEDNSRAAIGLPPRIMR